GSGELSITVLAGYYFITLAFRYHLEEHPAALPGPGLGVDGRVGIADGGGVRPGEPAVDGGGLLLAHHPGVEQPLDQRGVVLHDVVEGRRPECRERVRVGAVDADLVRDSHARTVAPSTDAFARPVSLARSGSLTWPDRPARS